MLINNIKNTDLSRQVSLTLIKEITFQTLGTVSLAKKKSEDFVHIPVYSIVHNNAATL